MCSVNPKWMGVSSAAVREGKVQNSEHLISKPFMWGWCWAISGGLGLVFSKFLLSKWQNLTWRYLILRKVHIIYFFFFYRRIQSNTDWSLLSNFQFCKRLCGIFCFFSSDLMAFCMPWPQYMKHLTSFSWLLLSKTPPWCVITSCFQGPEQKSWRISLLHFFLVFAGMEN